MKYALEVKGDEWYSIGDYDHYGMAVKEMERWGMEFVVRIRLGNQLITRNRYDDRPAIAKDELELRTWRKRHIG